MHATYMNQNRKATRATLNVATTMITTITAPAMGPELPPPRALSPVPPSGFSGGCVVERGVVRRAGI